MMQPQGPLGLLLIALLSAHGLTVASCGRDVAPMGPSSSAPKDPNSLSLQDAAAPNTPLAPSATWSATSMPNVAVTSGQIGPVVFPPLSGTAGLFASEVDLCADQAPSAPYLSLFINLTPNASGSVLGNSSDRLQNPPLGIYELAPASTASRQPSGVLVAEGYVTVSEAYLDAASGRSFSRTLSSFAITGGHLTVLAIDTNARTVRAVVEGLETSNDALAAGGPASYTGPNSITLSGLVACDGFVFSNSGVGKLPFYRSISSS